MKLSTILVFIFFSSNLVGQYFNGPANIREKPNGEILFSLNDFVKVDLEDISIENKWFKVILFCQVNPDALINNTLIKSNTTLFSVSGDSIGYTLNEFRVRENRDINYWKYNELKMISIFLDGYTFKTNLRDNLTKSEIINYKPSYNDNSNSSILQFQDENGLLVTEIEQCTFYNPTIKIDGIYENVIVKQIQHIKRTSGMEGQESSIEIEIVRNCLKDLPIKNTFTVEADKVEIEENVIKAVKYGCCGAEDACQLYNIKAFTKLMEFDEVLYQVDIPNSNIEGFIGFKFCFFKENKTDIGIITFSTPDSIINKAKLVTHDKNTFDRIMRFVPEMEYELTNDDDVINFNKTGLTLWSKNHSKDLKDISDFSFLIHFIDDETGEEFTQKLEFKNGYINGNPNKEFDIVIK